VDKATFFRSFGLGVDFAVAVKVVPLAVLFLLEHLTIMCEMDSCHNAVHTISHYVIHNIVNDLHVHYFL